VHQQQRIKRAQRTHLHVGRDHAAVGHLCSIGVVLLAPPVVRPQRLAVFARNSDGALAIRVGDESLRVSHSPLRLRETVSNVTFAYVRVLVMGRQDGLDVGNEQLLHRRGRRSLVEAGERESGVGVGSGGEGCILLLQV